MRFYFNDYKKKKEKIWLSPMTKSPIPTENSQNQSHDINNASKTKITQPTWDGKLE